MERMKVWKGSDTEKAVYRPADLADKQDVIAWAKALWKEQCALYLAAHGDRGTCVLGAGIELWMIPKGCRKPQIVTIIDQHDVTNAQGCLVWEESVERVLEMLRSNGIEAEYKCGHMD